MKRIGFRNYVKESRDMGTLEEIVSGWIEDHGNDISPSDKRSLRGMKIKRDEFFANTNMYLHPSNVLEKCYVWIERNTTHDWDPFELYKAVYKCLIKLL